MKLLSIPSTTVEYVNIMTSTGGGRVPARTTISNVKISCLDKPQNTAEEVWHKLKGECELDLGTRIDKIIFLEENKDIILYGVVPIAAVLPVLQGGRVFECHIDRYEVIPHRK